MTFRFAHAFFRQTLYEETFAPRRIRMHQQVGRALEEAYTSRLEEHADELAEHFSQSTELEDLEKALKYGEMAARRAKSVYAWSEAARLLDQALQVQEVLNPDDKARRCDLLLDLGDALLPAGEGGRVVETVAPEAFALAEALNDRTRAVRACWTASMGLFRVYGPVEGMRQKWFQAMDRYAAPRTRERVFADIGMSVVAREEGRSAEATALIRGALDLARRLDDPDLIVLAMTVLMLWEAFRREGWRLAQELAGLSRAGVSPIHLGYMLVTGGWVHLAHGERDKFEELSGELADLAERTRDTQVLLWSLGRDILPRTLDGRFDDALADYDGVLERAEELGLEGRARIMAGLHTPRPLMYLGRPEEALAAVAPRPAPWPGVRAACLAHAGRPGEARDAISEEMQSAPSGRKRTRRLTSCSHFSWRWRRTAVRPSSWRAGSPP